jgi:hypothetical protein
MMIAVTFGTAVWQDELHGWQFVLLHALLQMYCSVGLFQWCQHDYSIEFIIDFMEYIFEHEPQQFCMWNHQGHVPIHIVMQHVDTIVGSHVHVNEMWTFLLEKYPNLQELLTIKYDWLLKLPLKMALSVSMTWLKLNHELWRLIPWLTTCIPWTSGTCSCHTWNSCPVNLQLCGNRSTHCHLQTVVNCKWRRT